MKITKALSVVASAVLALTVAGCGSEAKPQSASPKQDSPAPSATPAKQAPTEQPKAEKYPLKIATVSNTIDFLPWYVAQKKGIFDKYNLKVELKGVDGGVTALRGLQSGDFQVIASLPESIITAVDSGANVRIVGALSSKTLFSVFVSPEIQKVEDLKGKAAAVLQPGNGVDILMRWWLKKHGLEPDKDVRIVSAGATPARLAALKSGQVQVTLLQPPNDVMGEKAGMKRFAIMSDELKNYNQDVIAANGNLLKDHPDAARNFMAATAEAIQFIKDPANKKEAIEIAKESIGTDEDTTTKCFDFVYNAIPDKAKLDPEGIKWAIKSVKEVGGIKNELPVEKVVDDQYVAK